MQADVRPSLSHLAARWSEILQIMATDVVIEIRLCSTFRTAPRASPHGARCGVLVLERTESHPTAQRGPDTVT